MTKTIKRIGLGIGATAIAVIVAGTSYQSISAQGPAPGGQFGGPGGGRMGRGPGGPGGGPFGMLGPMMLGRLNLTDDQRGRVRQIVESHREEEKALRQRAMKAHEALLDAITATFDESAIRARAADVAAVDADQAVAQARVYGEILPILTAEQQQTLKDMQAKMKERQQRMSEHRPGQGRGAGNPGQRH
jgi:Spy/CpxP family protein refolding chaperone